MSINLIEQVKALFDNDFHAKAAASLGETNEGVQKAMSGAIPSALVRLLQKSENSSEATGIYNHAMEAANANLANNPSTLLQNTAGLPGISNITNYLFGDKLGAVGNELSNFAGIKSNSAISLLSMVGPAILSFLGLKAQEKNMGAADLSTMIQSHRDAIISSVPSGFNLAGALGLTSLSSLGRAHNAPPVSEHHRPAHITEAEKKGTNWLLPLILLLLALGLIWYFMKSCNKGQETTTTTTTDTTVHVEATPPTMTAMTPIKVKLADGTEINAYKGGIEDMLVTYLNSSEPIDKERWFDFDNLNFKMASAEITDSSMMQVKNIAAILKAYPKTKIKIGGYTDKTGDEAANMKLSQDRADATLNAIKNAGGSAGQLVGAEGYGSKFAKIPATASDEERKPDRHISVNVVEK